MSQRRAPWFLGLTSATVLLASRAMSGPPAPSSPAAGSRVETSGAAALGLGAAPAKHAWANVRVFDDFFGILPPSAQNAEHLRGVWAGQRVDLRRSTGEPYGEVQQSDLERIAQAARDERYDLGFLVALVPDPIDSRLPSNFDFTLAGLQVGLNREGYLYERGWHPWNPSAMAGTDADERTAHHTAGVMLFSKQPGGPGQKSLLAVFLVGETPKGGIHRQAFHQAVTFIASLQQTVASLAAARHEALPGSGSSSQTCAGTICVLGPSFSGSAASLMAEIRSLAACRFRIVSGSATAPGLEADFKALGDRVNFERTVVPDDQLTETAFKFLQDKLGWDLDHAALLTEGDTAYGNGFSGRLTILPFPSGVSAIRNAWEEREGGREPGAAQGVARQPAVAVPRAALEISLADRGTPADSVLELSPLTSRIEELAMTSLLRTIRRKNIRYVGIVATDVKDEVFLAEEVRRWAPDVTLFLLESNLIYFHPHFHPALFGSLVITSFPTLTNEVVAKREADRSAQGDTIAPPQFGSETQEGIFLATKCLLGLPVEPRAVWISVAGNDTLSPVARLPLSPVARLPSERRREVIFFAEGNDLQLLYVLAAFCILAYWLGDVVYLRRGGETAVAPQPSHPPGPRLLLVLGQAVLCVLGAGIVVLALLPTLAPEYLVEGAMPHAGLHYFLLGATVLAYLGLLLYVARKAAQTTPRIPFALLAVATVLGGVLVCCALAACILGPWSLGQPGFLYLRMRRFANGLSPLVSLAWLGGALIVWISVELKRQQLRERHHFDWPIPDDAEPALSGSARESKAIERLLESILPRDLWAVALVLIPTVAVLLKATQPLADPLPYGYLFVLLAVGAFVLTVASFYRFGRTWLLLRHILGRLEYCRFRPSFASIAKTVRWDPMKSFVWYAPSFRSLAQAVERLEELEKKGHEPAARARQEVSEKLRAAYQAEAEGRFSDEVEARQGVSSLVDQIGPGLAAAGLTAEVQEFYAFRVVGYLRHVFVQERYALMGAMAPALLLIASLSSYTFVPSRFMLVLFWAALLTASALSLIVFVQMDHNVVLREIAGRAAGKVTFDRAFLSNIFTYAALPLLALVSSQLPEVGRVLGHWLDPLTRLLEVG